MEKDRTDSYAPSTIEEKWQARWEDGGTNAGATRRSRNAERPFYNLMMFPYPSAEGLHVGNIYAFTGADIHGRFRRLTGDDVFEPIGFDAFGIHSENFALKIGTHPMELIPRNVANFTRQLKRIGGDVRLEPHGEHHRPVVLPVDAVDLPEALRGGPGGEEGGAGQLVPLAATRCSPTSR